MAKIHVAKIVATATDTAWSQAYHAGGVTAVLSVKHKEEKASDSVASLHIVGKDLLNTFESEYFPLETKNLLSIRKAVETTYNKSSQTHTLSFMVAVVVGQALYVVLAGTGKISLFRGGKQAVLLDQPLEEEAKEILAGSGFLESGDTVVLETIPFSEIISASTLTAVLENNKPTDAAEILSPKIHEVQEGGAAGLILSFEEQAPQPIMPEEIPHSQPAPLPQEEPEKPFEHEVPPPEPAIAADANIAPLPSHPRKKMTHRQRLFLTIAVVLLLVFGASIYFSLNFKKQNQTASLFATSFPPAQKKYDEGQGLLSLNKSLAQSDLQSAKDMLTQMAPKFPKDSSEEKQIQDLLQKVNTSLDSLNQANQASATQVDSTSSPMLAFAKGQSTQYVTQDDTNFYTADATGITQTNKKTNKSSAIIKNASDWKSVGGFATYLGNFYLLDTNDGILKYVPAGSSFGKSAYFSGTSPDLSKAISIAIDGAIWILGNDGSVTKYTRGKQDSLTVSGLDKPFSSPVQIVTTVDFNNVYVLDKGNGRIVELSKSGAFVNQYANSIISQAQMMDISEKDKKIFVLSGGNVYEIDLK